MYEEVVNGIKQIFTEEELQEIESILCFELKKADDFLKKYSEIVTKYITIPDYQNEKVTLQQAENCVKLYVKKVNLLQSIYSKYHSLMQKE